MDRSMWVVWKYKLEIVDIQSFWMPKHAELLPVQIHRGVPCLWAFCDASNQREERHFRIMETEQRYGVEGCMGSHQPPKYITSFQEGRLVFHVFEVFHNPSLAA